MIRVDLESMEHAAAAFAPCIRSNPTRLAPTTRLFAVSGAQHAMLLRATEAHAMLAEVAGDYRRAVHGSNCACKQGQLESIFAAGVPIGVAAAQTACWISTWNAPLPPTVATEIANSLAVAARELEALDSCVGDAAIPVRLGALSRALSTAKGEQVYHDLMAFSQMVQSSLGKSRCCGRQPR